MLKGHRDLVSAVRFSPDGRYVVTASHDGTARIWDAATGEQLLELLAGGDSLTDVDFDPAGRRIATAGLAPGTVRIFNCEVCGSLGELLDAVPGHVTRALTAAEREDFLAQ